MSNPWDVPPWPIRGDEHADHTYVGVGRVTSTWEFVEAELSRLYSLFKGGHNELGLLLEYGQGTIFRTRFANLCEAADRYFIKNCNHNAEVVFHQIGLSLVGFSDRRNEVAHGVVSNVQTMLYFRQHIAPDARSRANYMLIPPFHTVKKHDPTNGGPAYAYTSAELTGLWALLINLVHVTHECVAMLLPPEQRDAEPPAQR